MRPISYRIILIATTLSIQAFTHSGRPQKNLRDSCDSIFVSKSKKVMILYVEDQAIRSFEISIGKNQIGHKQKQGDNCTPEGIYYINGKNRYSSYYKNLGISYPNENDRKEARKHHVKPGGDIKIHGYTDPKGSTNNRWTRYAYTWGCIGVTNSDMDDIFSLVKVGAVIRIEP